MSVTDLNARRRRDKAEMDGNAHWTVRDMAVELIEQIDAGEIDPKGAALILVLDEDESSIHRIFRLVSLRYSEAISVLEIEKDRILAELRD